MTSRTITLTGRQPVKIDEEKYPLIASATDNWHDNQYECQANRTSKWFVGVRQNEVGSTVVYAIYKHDSQWQGERCIDIRRGEHLGIAETEQICRSIESVCRDIAAAEHAGDDAERWSELAHECIADLPAETLD